MSSVEAARARARARQRMESRNPDGTYGQPPAEMVQDTRSGQYVDTAAAAQRMGPAQGANINFLQGAPFVGEFVDEGMGRLDEAVTGRPREVGTAITRQSREQFREDSPGMATAAQVGGGIAGGLPIAAAAAPMAGAMAPAGLLGRIGAGAAAGGATGAVEGAVSGYGAGEGGDRGQTAREYATMGGLLGAGLGGAIPAAASAGRHAYGAVRDAVGATPSRIPGMSRPASNRVLQALEADGVDPSRLRGDTAMPADMGPATRGLLDETVNVSPTGAAIAGRNVGDRAARSAGRLNQVFDDVLGGPEGQQAIQRAIREANQPGVRQAYQQAYATPIDYSSAAGRRIEDLVNRLPGRQARRALEAANDMMRYDGLPSPQGLVSIADDGTATFQRMPNVMEVDYLKRAFDGLAQDSIDGVTGRMSSDGRFANRIARDLADALGDAVPPYREALSQAADGFTLERAAQTGRRLLRSQTMREEVSDWAANATPIERRTLAQALRSDIDEQMANVQRAVSDGNMEAREAQRALRAMSSRSARDKVEAALGDGEAKRIFDALDEASSALETRAAVAANSRTAGRQEGVRRTSEELASQPGQIARDAASGRIGAAPQSALEHLAGNTPADRAARQDALYAEVAEYLTGLQGPQAQAAARQAQGLLSAIPQQQGNALNFGRGTGAAVGLLGHPLGSHMLRER